MLGMVRFFLANGAKKFIAKYSKQALDKVKSYIKNNKEKVSKMKTDIKQEPVEKLPMFKKLSNRYVSEGVNFKGLNKKTTGYKFDHLSKGTDISKGM